MNYDFSAHFLRVIAPDTTFSDAWESLCFCLLDAGQDDPSSLMRFKAPDRGIDIWDRSRGIAYQCKSTEQGAMGSIPADESISSLRTACDARPALTWAQYVFATNARYTGVSAEKILQEGQRLGIPESDIHFFGPEYWDRLCGKHTDLVRERFDYRITASNQDVIQALRSARYYDHVVQRYAEDIDQANFSVVLTNNRTPIEIRIPFSPALTVETCIDVAMSLLGISLKWHNFADLRTSTGPSVSLAVDGKKQGFDQPISALNLTENSDVKIWITIVWKDEEDKKGDDGLTQLHMALRRYYFDESLSTILLPRPETRAERKRATIQRAEEILQAQIWHGAGALKLNQQGAS